MRPPNLIRGMVAGVLGAGRMRWQLRARYAAGEGGGGPAHESDRNVIASPEGA